MRLLLAVIIIVYLVGVGVVLSPIVRSTWNNEPASVLADSIAQALPNALAWPVRAARIVSGSRTLNSITISQSLRPADISATCASTRNRA